MDLVNSVVGMQQAGLFAKIDFAVAKKILDNQYSQGQSAVELIDAAEQGVNNAGDQLVAAATGLGGQLDVQG